VGQLQYLLKEELGAEMLNRTLRRLLGEFAFKGAPYANSMDFLRILREEAGPGGRHPDRRSLRANHALRQTPTELAEAFEVGLFSAEPGKVGFTRQSVLAFERRALRDGEQQIVVQSAAKPAFAGVDPYNKRIDRESDDNIQQIEG